MAARDTTALSADEQLDQTLSDADARLAEEMAELDEQDAAITDDDLTALNSPDILNSPDRFDLAALPSAPLQPGSPNSPFRRCACLGIMPGRACPACQNSRWLKVCPACQSLGLVNVHARSGATFQRKDRCGFCMGRGTLAARAAEVDAAQSAWQAYLEGGGSIRNPFEDQTGIVRRDAKLPKAGGGTHAKPSKPPLAKKTRK